MGCLSYTHCEFDFTDLEVAAVETMIAKIDPTAKPLDVDAIKAAREAYDALGETTISAEMYAKLLSLETLAAELKETEADKAINAVQSLKIKTTTKLYKGKKIKVNWTVTGDTSAIDGYRIYVSTKKTNSGYKYLAKTTKKYINHTSIKKNVKKGTRVYYRVRAYAEIDGVRYFSDYSTVGNRIWK